MIGVMAQGVARNTTSSAPSGAAPEELLFGPVVTTEPASKLIEERQANSVLFSLEDLAQNEEPEPTTPTARLATRPANTGGSGLIDLSTLLASPSADAHEPGAGDDFVPSGSLVAEIQAAQAAQASPPPAAPLTPKRNILPLLLAGLGAVALVLVVWALAIEFA